MMIIVAGFLFTIFLFGFICFFSGTAPWFFADIPSALVILFPLIFFLAVSKNGKIITGYFVSSFKKEYAYSRMELLGISIAIKNTMRFVSGTGAVIFLAGIIACLGHIGNMDLLGPNLAVSLITPMYALAVNFFVLFPVKAWACNKINALDA